MASLLLGVHRHTEGTRMNKQRLGQEPAPVSPAPVPDVPHLTDMDVYLFNEGSHHHLYRTFGAHLATAEGQAVATFTVWAPNAAQVFVSGDFNDWDKASHPLHPHESSGVWEGFVPGVDPGTRYKYHIVSHRDGY